jgi:hypothetical protein
MAEQNLEVVSVEELRMIRGTDLKRYKYIIAEKGVKTYCAIVWDSIIDPIIYDYDKDSVVSEYSWFIMSQGYAYSSAQTMHTLVWGDYDTSNRISLDHINNIKVDNRIRNLRLATQSMQNSNRPSRCDKMPPPQELQDLGIDELPRHIRWEHNEKKFIIEKHPTLLKRVQDGLIKKPYMSCTKSTKLSIVEKFQDALARYQELGTPDEQLTFEAFRNQLLLEYNLIRKCVMMYKNGNPQVQADEDDEEENIQIIEAKRATAPNKKGSINIPEEYGLSHGDLPAYCMYKKPEANRKDGFEILGHPGFKYIEGKEDLKKGGSWNIRRGIPPLEKRRIFLKKYVELQRAASLPFDRSGHTQRFLDILEEEKLL